MDLPAAEEWIRRYVHPVGAIEVVHERPWSTVMRIALRRGRIAWFKACGDVQAFEPRLTAELFIRWPHLVPEVIAHEQERSWLLMADAGTRIGDLGNDPKSWLSVLPRYAVLQRGETAHALRHLDHGVTDLRTESLPARYDDLLYSDLPLETDDRRMLEALAPRFAQLCRDIAHSSVIDTIQHDDLHMNNVFVRGGTLRVLDWGDASISHPFVSLIPTFRFLEERNGLPPSDAWFGRLRDAYLEPWGPGLGDLFASAMCVGGLAHAIASLRQRAVLSGEARELFDVDLAARLRRASAGIRRY